MMYLPRKLGGCRPHIFAILSLIAVAKPVGAASPQPPSTIGWSAARMDSSAEGRIDQLVAANIERGNMSGCVVLIGRRAGVAFERAYGNRSVEPKTEVMTTDT